MELAWVSHAWSQNKLESPLTSSQQSSTHACHYVCLSPRFLPVSLANEANGIRIMLIDLYERPYSPEASKSRAFIDRVLALSGPDGGVVGGEDGVSTQRPLKDGGREAWDMIRRLRQKAWQKAGLNPQMLWTEQDQIQAGIASPAGESRGIHGPLSSRPASALDSPTMAAMAPRQPAAPDGQATDFNRTFYNMTRSHILPAPAPSASLKPSPLRYSYQLPPLNPGQSSISLPTPQYNTAPAAITLPNAPLPGVATMVTSPVKVSGSPPSTHSPTVPSNIQMPPPQQSAFNNTIPSPQMSFMDAISPPLMGVPTPPSMVDPNLNFDWDQWDAVFGQHLPVADELMELDPVAGLEYANLANTAMNSGVSHPPNMPPALSSSNGVGLPPAWADPDSSNPQIPSSEWTGYC